MLGLLLGMAILAVFRLWTQSKSQKPSIEYDKLIDGINGLQDGVVFFDEHLRLALFNDQYLKMYEPASGNWELGMHLEQIARDTARHCLGYQDPHDIEEFVAARITAHHETRNVEQQLVSGRWLHVNQHSLGSGWTVGTRTDVSSLKMRERELSDAREQLEERVRERTEELSKANQAKSEFLATVSHELRTPMNGVLGMAGLLLQSNLTSKQAHSRNKAEYRSKSPIPNQAATGAISDSM